MPYQKDENEIGALWSRVSAKGEYMTGLINGQQVVCFRTNKKSEKQPDWRVLKSKPSEERQAEREPLDRDDIGF